IREEAQAVLEEEHVCDGFVDEARLGGGLLVTSDATIPLDRLKGEGSVGVGYQAVRHGRGGWARAETLTGHLLPATGGLLALSTFGVLDVVVVSFYPILTRDLDGEPLKRLSREVGELLYPALASDNRFTAVGVLGGELEVGRV